MDPRETHGNTSLMTPAFTDAFKCDFKYQFRLHGANRTEFFNRIAFDKSIDFPEFLICQA